MSTDFSAPLPPYDAMRSHNTVRAKPVLEFPPCFWQLLKDGGGALYPAKPPRLLRARTTEAKWPREGPVRTGIVFAASTWACHWPWASWLERNVSTAAAPCRPTPQVSDCAQGKKQSGGQTEGLTYTLYVPSDRGEGGHYHACVCVMCQ